MVTSSPTSRVVFAPETEALPFMQRSPRVAIGIVMVTSSIVRQVEVESEYHRLHAATFAPLFRP